MKVVELSFLPGIEEDDFFIALSNIFENTFSSDIGLQLLISDLVPPLCIGVIIAILKESGMMLLSKILLKM